MTLCSGTLDRLRELLDEHDPAKDRFMTASSDRRANILDALVTARDALLERALGERRSGLPICSITSNLASALHRYATISDWAIYDAIQLAACLPFDSRRLGEALAPRALLFLSIRMLDDSIDGHVTYKGHYATIVGELKTSTEHAIEVNTIASLLIGLEASRQVDPEDLALAQTTLHGQLFEFDPVAADSLASYESMVTAKMVAYGLVVYGPLLRAIEPPFRHAVDGFVRRSLMLGQVVNDLVDRESDEERHQPNRWSLAEELGDTEAAFLSDLELLAEGCRTLGAYAPYGAARIADLARYTLEAVDVPVLEPADPD